VVAAGNMQVQCFRAVTLLSVNCEKFTAGGIRFSVFVANRNGSEVMTDIGAFLNRVSAPVPH